jgi:hypothetical protein
VSVERSGRIGRNSLRASVSNMRGKDRNKNPL